MKLEKSKSNKRNSNIELTRIIAMFFIVAGHFVNQGGKINYSFCLNDYLLVFFSSGSRIAVNVFLLIGIWFMVDAKFTVDRIFKLYLQLVTYCIPITIVMILINHENITVKSIICGLIPFSFRALWFASAYITLIIFKPFLDKVLSWNKKQLCLLVVLLLSFVSLMSTISRDSQGYVLDSLWFLVVYLFVGTAKKYDFLSKISKITPVIVCILSYLVLTIFLFLNKCYITNNSIVIFLMNQSQFFRENIRTLPNFTIALSIVVIILNFKEKNNKIINKLSKCTFTVYIIHQIPSFYMFLWKEIYKYDFWADSHLFWYLFIVFALTYIICYFIDEIRLKFIEPILLRSKIYNKIRSFADKLYQDI